MVTFWMDEIIIILWYGKKTDPLIYKEFIVPFQWNLVAYTYIPIK